MRERPFHRGQHGKILEEMREKSDHILRTDFRVRGYGTSDRQKENKPGKVQKNKPKI